MLQITATARIRVPLPGLEASEHQPIRNRFELYDSTSHGIATAGPSSRGSCMRPCPGDRTATSSIARADSVGQDWRHHRRSRLAGGLLRAGVGPGAGLAERPVDGLLGDLPLRSGHTRQLRRFKAAELILAELAPAFHRRLRGIYDRVGPPLARRLTHAWIADLAWIALKPAELVASWCLRVLVRDSRSAIERIWPIGPLSAATPGATFDAEQEAFSRPPRR